MLSFVDSFVRYFVPYLCYKLLSFWKGWDTSRSISFIPVSVSVTMKASELMLFSHGRTETSGRRDESGLWTFEGADCRCGGEVGGAVGRCSLFSLFDDTAMVFFMGLFL